MTKFIRVTVVGPDGGESRTLLNVDNILGVLDTGEEVIIRFDDALADVGDRIPTLFEVKESFEDISRMLMGSVSLN